MNATTFHASNVKLTLHPWLDPRMHFYTFKYTFKCQESGRVFLFFRLDGSELATCALPRQIFQKAQTCYKAAPEWDVPIWLFEFGRLLRASLTGPLNLYASKCVCHYC